MSQPTTFPSRRFIPTTLMLGNLVVGTSVIAPAGMLNELSRDLDVSIGQASLLITLGAIMLCLGSPLLSWATSRMDRRVLLSLLLLVILVTHVMTVFVTSFAAVLALRLVMLAAAAPFTPQAAGVVGLLAPAERRASTIAYVFLGWSMAVALGLPLMTYLASRFGWQSAFGAIAVMAALSGALTIWRLPAGLYTPPVDLKAWGELFRNRLVLLLLTLTIVQISSQFMLFTFIGPLLARLTESGPDAIGLGFALYGIAGFAGNVLASSIVGAQGAFKTSLLASLSVTAGLAIWAFTAGTYLGMAAGMAVWGFGFAAQNSMQQARLVGAAPPLAGASVALNTSALYIGQAIGSAIGSALFVHGYYVTMGYAAVALMLASFGLLALTRPSAARPS